MGSFTYPAGDSNGQSLLPMVIITVEPTQRTLPEAPTGLKARLAKAKVNLSWTQSATPGVIENRIYRGVRSTDLVEIAAVPAHTAYSDKSVDSGTTSCHAVTAVSEGGESEDSNVASVLVR
jgi:fibronectin type 3 domain-containing protein